MTSDIEEQINSIFLEFLNYLPFSEDDSIEVEAKHDALNKLKSLITKEIKQARLDEHNYIAWQPNEASFIEKQADRISELNKD